MEGYVSVATLLKESTHESIIPRPLAGLAGGDRRRQRDPGARPRPDDRLGGAQRRRRDRQRHGRVPPRPVRGGGMVFLRFRAWLQEVDETAGGIGAVYFEEVRFHRGVTAAHAYGASSPT